MKPEWNKLWKRWEVPDVGGSCEGMRGLEYDDLSAMADEQIRARGYEPGLHEDWVDEIVAKLSKKYKLYPPMPKWIVAASKETVKIVDGVKPGWSDYADLVKTHCDIIRKHAPKT